MNSGETEVSIRVAGKSPANPRVPSVPLSINFFLAGVIFPISCLIHSYCGLNAHLVIPWQSGEPVVYIGLLLACPSILAFLPMMRVHHCTTSPCILHSPPRNLANLFMNHYGIGLSTAADAATDTRGCHVAGFHSRPARQLYFVATAKRRRLVRTRRR